ncbi:hypothetical protein DY000_02007716 [Brassica cretica]|uniref:Uncharacterized protein n=1 Tax=Brassica cretica TaxID=69181 RepID=A0ABQ7BYI4_BRACR|nr:hypothetical protein DY000_02007716 [Brassica cretica]
MVYHYHLRSRDGAPLVEEPSWGIRGNYPFGDGWNNQYVFVKIQGPFSYPTSYGIIGKLFSLILALSLSFLWDIVLIDAWFLPSDVSCMVSFAGEAVAKHIVGVPRRFPWVTFLVSKEALRHSRVWGKPYPFSFHLIGFRPLISCVAFSQGMW